MSHFTTIQVRWTDPEAILDALADYLGIAREAIQVDEAGIPIRNFQGRLTGEAPDCEIVVGREFFSGNKRSTGDLGVKRGPDGQWQVHIDDYGWEKPKEQILKELTQLYGYHKARRLAEAKGYRVKKVQREGGKLRLVLARRAR